VYNSCQLAHSCLISSEDWIAIFCKMELVWNSMSFIFFTFDLSLSVAGCYFPQDGASLETIKCGSVREKMQTYPYLHQAYHSFCTCHFTVQMIKTLHGAQGPRLSHSKSERRRLITKNRVQIQCELPHKLLQYNRLTRYHTETDQFTPI
jgi:hypothetical protein